MKTRRLLILFTILFVISAACNLPIFGQQNAKTPDPAGTAAAQTVEVISTQLAQGNQATAQPPAVTVIVPTEAQQATQPEATLAVSTATVQPTETTTQAAEPCDRASFVRDITIPDGVSIPAGSAFTKTWELKNVGTCTWTTNYALVFANDGNAMNGPVAKSLDAAVAPGETVKVSVDLTAPAVAGKIKGKWMLRNASGATFGVGPKADKSFWVEITVANQYLFAENLCSAEWSSGAGKLPCPGKDNDTRGFTFITNNPKMENGNEDDEPTIYMAPQEKTDGEIVGRYPAVMVPGNGHFKVIIGCVDGAEGCNVNMKVGFKVGDAAEKTLGEWNELYDGNIKSIDVDLAPLGLTAKTVAFSFYVNANGEKIQDKAFWLAPRIEP